jgi:hypothetical protein
VDGAPAVGAVAAGFGGSAASAAQAASAIEVAAAQGAHRRVIRHMIPSFWSS